MEAPAEMSLRDRIHWAAIAAIIGVIHDGPELGDQRRLFDRLEAACRSFGVPKSSFDDCARILDFHYVRSGDYYASKKDLADTQGTLH